MKIHHSRIYTLNENFFDKWSPEMAYIIGFWFADGYMRQEKSYRIVFSSNDWEILEQIRTVLGSSNPIRKQPHTQAKELVIHSKHMYGKLTQLGGIRHKSSVVDFPYVPQNYLKDFIRGFFDGDGGVFFVNYISTKNHKPRKELRSNFTSGSKQFLGKLNTILSKKLGLSFKKLCGYNDGRSLKLGYGTKDTRKLLRFIYYPGFKIGLLRKAHFFSC